MDAAAFLKGRIAEAGGSLSFERFMADALHHPDFGYYARHVRGVGVRGDFATTATISGVLAGAIARWVIAERHDLGWNGPWDLVEIGAGSGSLAAGVLRHLGWWRRRNLRFHIVETSAPLREIQRKSLRGYRVEWSEDIRSVLGRCQGRAILYSNELVDAFPCRVFRWDAATRFWRELHLVWNDGVLQERFEAREEPMVRSTSFGQRERDGQRIEVHESYRRWLAAWVPRWREGSLLTIDYGGTAEEIYRRRPRGTLRAYAFHQRLEGSGVYARFGRQDITADVNFDDLESWGRELGLRSLSRTSQAAFVRERLPGKLEQPGRAAAFVLDPGGAGEAFQVLQQRREEG